MEESTKDRILKLLELTRSENDGEALNALRKANDIREKEGLQWAELFQLSAPKSVLPPVFRNRPAPPKIVTVEMMFDQIFKRRLSDALHAKMEEMHYTYELTGQLSGDECSMLINTFNGNCA
ncbi:MAG: DUF2786 domain-containing protein [Candidatus Nitronauta litoralis]|uniref:DUF2786 domain-containing protein n=1 Tax=Candidatus Nitronauta litoralis TaxID=2705533 RepID=A0A7T0BUT2_9BACT|nr:MAG: DUF2786 domain-containing protein [Candidatus Nitronauta litoralis]